MLLNALKYLPFIWNSMPLIKVRRSVFSWLIMFFLVGLFLPREGVTKIYIDINSPSMRKFMIAVPDFRNLSQDRKHPELAVGLPSVVSNDLDLSGYFTPMSKEAFLEDTSSVKEDIRLKDWSVIGAELLLKGSYTCVGRSLEVEIRLFDVFWGRQILGKRVLGTVGRSRQLMHRLSNDIIRALTGYQGIFLSKLGFVGTASGRKEIYTSDYDGHNVKQITRDRSICLLPRWSPDGRRMAFTSYKDGGPMLYVKDMGSGIVKRISGRSGLNTGGTWSPDGSRLAATLSTKGNPDIFLIDLNGRIEKRLVDHWGIDVSPCYSPAGDKLAFVSNRSGSPQIYCLDLLTRSTKRLTFQGNYNTSPSWSSLDRIAFVSMENGFFDIYTMNMDGGGLERLTEGEGNNEDPCWSPDGRYIIFSSNRDGRYHLYLMNANGQNQRRITFLGGDQTAPSWSR
jgi:TolB protein